MQKNLKSSWLCTNLIVSAIFSFTPNTANAQDDSSPSINAPSSNGIKLAANEKEKTAMTHDQMIKHIRTANEKAKEARSFGHHPFGAILIGPDNERVVMSQGNLDIMRHCETEVSRRAADAFNPEYLSKCTLVTTMEPCVMCSGNIYFANIGSVVYGATEELLKKLTGTSQVNPTMNLPCRDVFAKGQKKITVDGPFPELEAELVETHKGFWK